MKKTRKNLLKYSVAILLMFGILSIPFGNMIVGASNDDIYSDEVTDMWFINPPTTILIGETVELNVYSEPELADMDNVIFTSSNPKCASVNQSGKVKALKSGIAVITVTAPSGVTATCEIKVKKEAQISEYSIEMCIGEKAKIKVTGDYDSLTWKSENNKIATVNQSGTITAKSTGWTTIYAIVDKVKLECDVEVGKPKISVGYVILDKGETEKLSVEYAYNPITWSSSNSSIATVSADGTVKAKGVGTAKIIGKTTSKYSVSCYVEVKALSPEFRVALPSQSKSKCTYIVMQVKNNGKKPLKILSSGYLSDSSSSASRYLYLVKGNTSKKLSSVTIQPGKKASVYFRVKGSSTRYNRYSEVYYLLKYDNVTYGCVTSNYVGTDYERF